MNNFQFFGKICGEMTIRRDPVKKTEFVDFTLQLDGSPAPVPFRAFGDIARTIYLSAQPNQRLVGSAQVFVLESIFRFNVHTVEFVDKPAIAPKTDRQIVELFKTRVKFDKIVNNVACVLSGISAAEIRELAENVVAIIANCPETQKNIVNISTSSIIDLMFNLFVGNQKTGYERRYIRDLNAYVAKWCKDVRA